MILNLVISFVEGILYFSASHTVDWMPKSLATSRKATGAGPRARVSTTTRKETKRRRGRPSKTVATGMTPNTFRDRCKEFEKAILPVVRSMFANTTLRIFSHN